MNLYFLWTLQFIYLEDNHFGGETFQIGLGLNLQINCSACTMSRSNPLHKQGKSNKSVRKPKKYYSRNHCKGPFIQLQNTNMLSPKSYNPSVQNIHYSTAYMIVCVLCGIPMLGAICACRESCSKGIWTLTEFATANSKTNE